MKKFIPYFFAAILITLYSLLPADIAFAQSGEIAYKTEGTPTGITPGRARSLAGSVVALISVIAGAVALARAKKPKTNGRNIAIASLLLGLIGIVLSIIHLAGTTGGFGTGGGKAGAIVALVIGLIGMSLGGRAFGRYQRQGKPV